MSIIKKMNKRVLGIIAVIIAMFVLAACGESAALKARREATEDVQELIDSIVLNGAVKDLYNNLSLIKDAKKGIKVSWVSSDESLIKIEENENGTEYTGKVDRPGADIGDKDVTLTATATLEYTYKGTNDRDVTKTETATKVFNLTVKALSAGQTIRDIAPIKTSDVADGAEVAIHGIVTGTFDNTKGGFFVSDATGSIFVYKTYDPANLKLGDEVKVYGNKGFYYGAPQVAGSAVSFQVISSSNAMPTPAETTIDTVAATDKTSTNLPGNRYKSYALLIKQQDGANQNYYLVDPYTGNKIQIYYRTYDATTTNLAQYINKYVNIIYTVYYYDTRISMWSVDYSEIAGSIEEAAAPVLSDQQKAELVESDVAKLFGDFTTTSTLTLALPTVNEAYAGTITWEALDANATVTVAGTTATVKWGVVDAATAVKVKATVVVGSYTLVKEYEVNVKPLQPITIAEFLALPYDSKNPDPNFYALEGIIQLYNDGSYLIDDAGNSVLVYKYKASVNGDRVIIIGKRSEFNYAPQMGNASLVRKVSSGNANPLTPIAMTIADIHAVDFANTTLWNKYIVVTGSVVKDGIYYNLQDGDKIVSLYQSNTAVLATLVGQRVTLKMYFYGISKTDGTGVWRMVFTGYEGEYALPELTSAEKLAAAGANLPITNNQELFGNVTLPATGDYATTIAWTSDNAALDAATGVITQGETDVTVVLTAVLSLGEDTLTVTRTVIVKALAAPLTVTEFLALADGENARVKGYIYEYADGSYLVGEDGKAVLAYRFKGADHGDLVVLNGTKDIYNGTHQLASGSTLVKTESKGNVLPLTATPMTIADIFNIDYTNTTLFNTYISVTATVVPDGSYFALESNGQKLSTYMSNNMVLEALLNKEVTLKAFLYGVSVNSTTKEVTARRIVFTGLEGEFPALTSTDKIALAKTKVTLTEGQEVTGNLTLLASYNFGVTITWASDNAAIDAVTGVVTRPANGAGDVNAKLTATFTVDETTETVGYNVVVKEQAPSGTESSKLDVSLLDTLINKPAGWEYSGITAVYTDKSLKLDGTGDYVISEEITIAGQVNFTIGLKANGGPAASGTVSVLGLDANGQVVETVNNDFSFAASTVFDFTGVLTNTSIKRIKIIYTLKTSGNLGLYTVKVNA
jgi:hypothetical protein